MMFKTSSHSSLGCWSWHWRMSGHWNRIPRIFSHWGPAHVSRDWVIQQSMSSRWINLSWSSHWKKDI